MTIDSRILIVQKHLSFIEKDSHRYGYFWVIDHDDPLFVIDPTRDLLKLTLIELIEYAYRVLFIKNYFLPLERSLSESSFSRTPSPLLTSSKTADLSLTILEIKKTLENIAHTYYEEKNRKEGLPLSYLPSHILLSLNSFSQS